jgi:hypothetical protein
MTLMGDAVPTGPPDDGDPVSELKRIRPEAAPAYELAYEEAVVHSTDKSGR